MTHGTPRPIPRPIPLYLPDTRLINPLLVEADLDTLDDADRASLATQISMPALCSTKQIRDRIEHVRQEGRERRFANVALYGQGISPKHRVYSSHAALTLDSAYLFGNDDVMVQASGIEDVRDIAYSVELMEEGRFSFDCVSAALAHLNAPGYFGVDSRRTGENLLRLYVGREGDFTLHAVFEPGEGGACVLVGDADEYGVRTHYAQVVEADVVAAAEAFAAEAGAEMRTSEIGEQGFAFWFTWPP